MAKQNGPFPGAGRQARASTETSEAEGCSAAAGAGREAPYCQVGDNRSSLTDDHRARIQKYGLKWKELKIVCFVCVDAKKSRALILKTIRTDGTGYDSFATVIFLTSLPYTWYYICIPVVEGPASCHAAWVPPREIRTVQSLGAVQEGGGLSGLDYYRYTCCP